MKWNEKETYQFVKIYFAYEHLWNTRHVAYKSNERRLTAYKEVIAEFKESTGIILTLNEVRVKIKNLKSTYSQELNKIRQRARPNYTYKPAMKWFAVWHKYIQNARKKMRNSMPEGNQELNTTDEDSQKMWLPLAEDGEAEVDPFETQNNEYVLIVKPEPNNTQSIGDKPYLYDINRKKWDQGLSIDTSELTLTGRGSIDSDLMKEDEFDIYGKYIASQLRSMDLQRALTLQLEIQNLVSKARLADLSSLCSNSSH